MIGHRRIVELLSRSVARDALPPSLIFAGPAGVGKRLTATAVAQSLNCLHPTLQSPPAKPDQPVNPEPANPEPEPARRSI